MKYNVEDYAWEIYSNGMKSRWVSGRVKNREDFKDCEEYDEYMEMAEDLIRSKMEREIDKCINCGVDTPYTIITPIDQRRFYIEGAGQLCVKCHRKIYKK